MIPLQHPVRAWIQVSDQLLTSVATANRATLSAFGLSPSDSGGQALESAPSIPSLAYEGADWTFDRTVDDPSHIAVGDRVQFDKRLTDEDVRRFAAISGDTNRLHLDDEFAAETRFGERIVHGTLVSGLISSALARLPGLTVYLSQDLEFLAPVSIGDRLTASVEVVEDLGDDRFRLVTVVTAERGETIVDGESIVLIDPFPEAAPDSS